MKAIYTVCTYNHIARAFTLADSVKLNCPDTRFIIGIVGEANGSTSLSGYEVIKADDMGIEYLSEMYLKYSALELNSALKPYFAHYILNKLMEVEYLIFLDSDILLFADLDPVYESLRSDSIVITPHSLSTVSDGQDFDDRIFLRSGIYNAGFFGLKRDEYSEIFLVWWMNKLRNQCFFDSRKGMFAEQLWMNLIPLYFEKVCVLKHLGCNVSYWNLHERQISERDGLYLVNESSALIFYHFSGAAIDCLERDTVSDHQRRYTFTNRPDVYPLFKLYIDSLKKYSFEESNRYYTINSKLKTKSKIIKNAVELYKKVIKKLLYIK